MFSHILFDANGLQYMLKELSFQNVHFKVHVDRYLANSCIAGVVDTDDRLIAGIVVTSDNLSPVSLLPAINYCWHRCYRR
jgi:hypothetical protein